MSVFSLNPTEPGLLDPQGKPFFTFGVNYEGYFDRAWAMWRNDTFDLALIEKDFAKARVSGFNMLRLFIQKENRLEIEKGGWQKIDAVFNLARKYGLYVMLTFNDEHSRYLARTGQFNAKICAHFKGDPIIHSWDIENEPRLYNLLVAVYPGGQCPLLTSALVDHYGELVPRSQTNRRRVPGNPWNDKNKTFYYYNAVEAYTRFTTDAIYSGLPSIVDYMNSSQSAKWQPFLRLLNQTIAAWIAPQMEPMKLADPNRLFSIGWNWEALAAMPANRALNFHQIHKYGSVGYKTLNKTFSILKALQRTFPRQPVIMGEFGYSSDESRKTETSRPVDPRIAALHEAALMCFIRSEGLAGGIKWMLNDVRNAPNPFEAGLGVYADYGQEKPSRRIYAHLASIWRSTQDKGHLRVLPDSQTHIRLHYQCEAGGLSGGGASEAPVTWQASEPTHIFTSWDLSGQVRVEADAPAQVQLNPAALSPHWREGGGASVYRLRGDAFSPEGIHPPGQPVSVSLTDDDPRLVTPLG